MNQGTTNNELQALLREHMDLATREIALRHGIVDMADAIREEETRGG